MWIAAAALTGNDAKGAWRIWRRDRRNHASPNSAQTESACAGALGVQLAGPATYFGKYYDKPTIGDAARPIEPEDILRANRMMRVASVLGLAAAAVMDTRFCDERSLNMKLVHGGDYVGYRERYGRDALDFSANVSPLGVPTGGCAARSARRQYQADRYPDPLCRELCAAIARCGKSCPSEWVLCGNGAADLIFRLALAKRPERMR